MELIQIYFNNFNKITIITNLFAFFVVVIFQFFPPGSGSGRESECGSKRIRIHSPAINPAEGGSMAWAWIFPAGGGEEAGGGGGWGGGQLLRQYRRLQQLRHRAGQRQRRRRGGKVCRHDGRLPAGQETWQRAGPAGHGFGQWAAIGRHPLPPAGRDYIRMINRGRCCRSRKGAMIPPPPNGL